jgi:hypothetical protein
MELTADDCIVRLSFRSEHFLMTFRAFSTDAERRQQISIKTGIASVRSRNIDGVEDGSEARQDVMRRDVSSRMIIISDLSQLQNRDSIVVRDRWVDNPELEDVHMQQANGGAALPPAELFPPHTPTPHTPTGREVGPVAAEVRAPDSSLFDTLIGHDGSYLDTDFGDDNSTPAPPLPRSPVTGGDVTLSPQSSVNLANNNPSGFRDRFELGLQARRTMTNMARQQRNIGARGGVDNGILWEPVEPMLRDDEEPLLERELSLDTTITVTEFILRLRPLLPQTGVRGQVEPALNAYTNEFMRQLARRTANNDDGADGVANGDGGGVAHDAGGGGGFVSPSRPRRPGGLGRVGDACCVCMRTQTDYCALVALHCCGREVICQRCTVEISNRGCWRCPLHCEQDDIAAMEARESAARHSQQSTAAAAAVAPPSPVHDLFGWNATHEDDGNDGTADDDQVVEDVIGGGGGGPAIGDDNARRQRRRIRLPTHGVEPLPTPGRNTVLILAHALSMEEHDDITEALIEDARLDGRDYYNRDGEMISTNADVISRAQTALNERAAPPPPTHPSRAQRPVPPPMRVASPSVAQPQHAGAALGAMRLLGPTPPVSPPPPPPAPHDERTRFSVQPHELAARDDDVEGAAIVAAVIVQDRPALSRWRRAQPPPRFNNLEAVDLADGFANGPARTCCPNCGHHGAVLKTYSRMSGSDQLTWTRDCMSRGVTARAAELTHSFKVACACKKIAAEDIPCLACPNCLGNIDVDDIANGVEVTDGAAVARRVAMMQHKLRCGGDGCDELVKPGGNCRSCAHPSFYTRCECSMCWCSCRAVETWVKANHETSVLSARRRREDSFRLQGSYGPTRVGAGVVVGPALSRIADANGAGFGAALNMLDADQASRAGLPHAAPGLREPFLLRQPPPVLGLLAAPGLAAAASRSLQALQRRMGGSDGQRALQLHQIQRQQPVHDDAERAELALAASNTVAVNHGAPLPSLVQDRQQVDMTTLLVTHAIHASTDLTIDRTAAVLSVASLAQLLTQGPAMVHQLGLTLNAIMQNVSVTIEDTTDRQRSAAVLFGEVVSAMAHRRN